MAFLMGRPRVLLLDTECLPMEGAFWGLFKQDIPHYMVFNEKALICACWKWVGEKKIHSLCTDPFKVRSIYNDFWLMVELREVLRQADIIVAQNGDKFDLRLFNTRLLKHGLPPLPPVPTVDTLKVYRKHFLLPTNRLDYIGRWLFGGGKDRVPQEAWKDLVLADRYTADGGPKKAKQRTLLKAIVKYCKRDVDLLGQAYETARPFIRNHPNIANGDGCTVCGSQDVREIKKAHRSRAGFVSKQFRCNDCGSFARASKSVSTSTKRSV